MLLLFGYKVVHTLKLILYQMLFRESVCTSLFNNATDLVLLGDALDGKNGEGTNKWLSVMSPSLFGYLVPRSELSSSFRHLSLSDRYEVTPIHLAKEWRNVSLLPGERVSGMHFRLSGPAGETSSKPELVVQTATRRMTLTRGTAEVFTENWSPPDGVVFLSTTAKSRERVLAIRNLPDQFCLIHNLEEMGRV